jgi:hypothetical protein
MMKMKHVRVLVVAVSAMLAAMAVLASSAIAREPAAGYGAFAGCPSPEEAPEKMEACITSTITGGHFQMGNKDVPIKNPIKLSGGITVGNHLIANKKGGLTPVKQLVPGGVIGLTGLDWLVNFLNIEALQLFAVTELAGAPGNPLFDDPFKLPIRVHLINPALGPNCYVGSFSSPINLNLTVNTTSPPSPNVPISGTSPELELDKSLPGVIDATGGKFVDNSFAAPGANGCVLTLFGFIPVSINGLVNAASGLPSAAGTNETIQNFDSQLALYPFVYP